MSVLSHLLIRSESAPSFQTATTETVGENRAKKHKPFVGGSAVFLLRQPSLYLQKIQNSIKQEHLNLGILLSYLCLCCRDQHPLHHCSPKLGVALVSFLSLHWIHQQGHPPLLHPQKINHIHHFEVKPPSSCLTDQSISQLSLFLLRSPFSVQQPE